jgi:hypothetical protein
MIQLFSISSKELCRILSSAEIELNPFELAIRSALTKANSEAEINAMRDHACMAEHLSNIPIESTGKVKVKKI